MLTEMFREGDNAVPLLWEAQAFDTAGLLKQILETHKPTDRKSLRRMLADLEAYEGVTGSVRFDENGEAHRELFTLTIRSVA